MNDWGNVAAVTRVYERPDVAFVNSTYGLIQLGFRDGDVMMPAVMGLPAHTAMNQAMTAFCDSPELAHCDTFLTMDCDHVFTSDTLERLRSSVAGQEFDALGALYIARARDFPLVLRLADGTTWDAPMFDIRRGWTRGDVVPVDSMGFGFTMIRRAAIERVREANGDDYWCWYPWHDASEDVAFFRQLSRLGMRAAVHTGVSIAHVGRNVSVPFDDWQEHKEAVDA